ncbi:DUF433 domain-containing protein [Deferribacter autotrophicus]|uniref:DUF433 domain-containing protein n=1 Tax=Deferribacter autotrophicus TaxID=500465 RepID=A0A5A8F1W0_9BACT|nr:DUF433 domain-containing protein [Deferribacter autotrophicus]KAA0257721.1 DUF433 domain-containing protein [Deferribacter autotrophicus]
MSKIDYKERIIYDSTVMLGKPVIKGTRIPVELILRRLSEGMPIEKLLDSYPNLTEEDIKAVLAYSADLVANEEVVG